MTRAIRNTITRNTMKYYKTRCKHIKIISTEKNTYLGDPCSSNAFCTLTAVSSWVIFLIFLSSMALFTNSVPISGQEISWNIFFYFSLVPCIFELHATISINKLLTLGCENVSIDIRLILIRKNIQCITFLKWYDIKLYAHLLNYSARLTR